MRKTDMNADIFALAEENLQKQGIYVENTRHDIQILEADELQAKNTGLFNNSNNMDKDFSVQFKYDTLSNIINDVCGVLQEISRTVGMVMVEKEKTQQVKIMSKAHIHQAEEQTKQVRIQEKEATKRICIQYETEIKKAELHMQEELAKLKYEKELFISNERRFDKELKDFSAVINNIIEQNRYYMQNMDLYPEALQKNNEELVKLVSKMVDLYILSSK